MQPIAMYSWPKALSWDLTDDQAGEDSQVTAAIVDH